MMRAIALDDEPVALEVIQLLAQKVSVLDVTAYFTDCFAASEYVRHHPVDLVFLDINMPDMSGLEWLRSIASPPLVVFTTAYSEHAVQSYELNAVDYLLKPFSAARFLLACHKAYDQYTVRHQGPSRLSASTALFLKSGYEQIRVLLQDILYVESQGNYVQFITTGQKVLTRLTMQEVAQLLPAHAFVRIHRSYFVAKNHITKLDRTTVWVHHVALPIGPGFAEQLAHITG
ncbi:LytTR family DNA-binding domain-containing protein [Hymenobacter sp. GOD-10R]|uniref:LytR/AlgR family response regulator transcription factor n=1 Tax=Hymenobacter sp. GOD-10R TaxID=3093922 RepID=UPI002D79FCD5|nr:LytTR family DNA-binding domain-containing protein [Hymenobacter sp. GOD-10R]WRQ31817.1 LytTR family DNA-binding domain-containing protein [Hymenobacter sp. GOD-10R]